jgi:hypothetical protein
MINIAEKELKLLEKLYDSKRDWKESVLHILHSSEPLAILAVLSNQPSNLGILGDNIFQTEMWNEIEARK